MVTWDSASIARSTTPSGKVRATVHGLRPAVAAAPMRRVTFCGMRTDDGWTRGTGGLGLVTCSICRRSHHYREAASR